MSDKIIGYTQGTFDLLHVGHVRLIQRAHEACDYLIVGVNDDQLVEEYKGRKPIIPVEERKELLQAVRWVDQVHICYTLDKKTAFQKYHFDKIFIGDDWKENERWKRTQEELKTLGAEVVFLSYTQGISTSKLREKIGIKTQEAEK